MIDQAEASLLLKRTLDELKFRVGIDITSEHRYAAYVDYRSCVSLLFRNYYGMSYQKIANAMKKNHATIIHSCRRGKSLLEGPKGNIHNAYENTKSIIYYSEVMLGIDTGNTESLQINVLDKIQDFIELNDLDHAQSEVLANGIIEKIQNRYCGI
jgi:hypothetical protein